MIAFHDRLREIRESLNLSQNEFSKRLGISRVSLTHYEAGDRTPDISFLKRLHEETGISLYYLLCMTDSKDDAWATDDAGRPSSYIFASRIGNPADRHNLNRSFRGILDKAGLPARGVHALRHTFATNWVQRSPDITALSRILGHTDPAFTYKTYCHADQKSMNQGMAMMEAYYSGVK